MRYYMRRVMRVDSHVAKTNIDPILALDGGLLW